MLQENGFEILAEIRKDALLRNISIVLCTKMTAEEDRRRAVEMGACGHIAKPLDLDKFGLAVKEFLEQNPQCVA